MAGVRYKVNRDYFVGLKGDILKIHGKEMNERERNKLSIHVLAFC